MAQSSQDEDVWAESRRQAARWVSRSLKRLPLAEKSVDIKYIMDALRLIEERPDSTPDDPRDASTSAKAGLSALTAPPGKG
jgi:hypothetical protein